MMSLKGLERDSSLAYGQTPRPCLTRLQSLSHLLLSGECSPDTSWTYMYQGFDIFAIFSNSPLLEVVIMMSRSLSK